VPIPAAVIIGDVRTALARAHTATSVGSRSERLVLHRRRDVSDRCKVSQRVTDIASMEVTDLLRLDLDELIRRYWLHVLPTGFVRIRHYGLLANRNRRQTTACCRELLSAAKLEESVKDTVTEKFLRLTGIDPPPAAGHRTLSR
jgi:hypothetical protein